MRGARWPRRLVFSGLAGRKFKEVIRSSRTAARSSPDRTPQLRPSGPAGSPEPIERNRKRPVADHDDRRVWRSGGIGGHRDNQELEPLVGVVARQEVDPEAGPQIDQERDEVAKGCPFRAARRTFLQGLGGRAMALTPHHHFEDGRAGVRDVRSLHDPVGTLESRCAGGHEDALDARLGQPGDLEIRERRTQIDRHLWPDGDQSPINVQGDEGQCDQFCAGGSSPRVMWTRRTSSSGPVGWAMVGLGPGTVVQATASA